MVQLLFVDFLEHVDSLDSSQSLVFLLALLNVFTLLFSLCPTGLLKHCTGFPSGGRVKKCATGRKGNSSLIRSEDNDKYNARKVHLPSHILLRFHMKLFPVIHETYRCFICDRKYASGIL